MNDQLPRANKIWWLNPYKLCLLFVLPLYIAAYSIPEILGKESLAIKGAIYFNFDYFMLGLVYIIVLIIALFIGEKFIPTQMSSETKYVFVPNGFLDVIALMTIAAYCIWFFDALLQAPGLITDLLSGKGIKISVTRETSNRIPGVTSMTQFGVAYVIFYLHRIWSNLVSSTNFRFKVYFYIIIALTVFRVFVWGERLALIEILMPVLVIAFTYKYNYQNRLLNAVFFLAPYFGIALIFFYFSITEYFRSWLSFYQYQNIGFFNFISSRMISYYYTALNNGSGLLTEYDWPTFNMEHVLNWLHRFPFYIGPVLSDMLGTGPPQWQFLAKYANPEFNNMSGIFTVIYDLGLPLALIYITIIGLVIGYLYKSFLFGRGVGRVIYPAVFIAILEMMRIPYLGESRAFSVMLPLLIGYFLFRKKFILSTKVVTNTVMDNNRKSERRILQHRKGGKVSNPYITPGHRD